MRVPVPRLALLLGVVLLVSPMLSASAQEVSPETDPPAAPRRGSGALFQSRADLVVLPVTVTDSRQKKHVTGLTMADFHVYEDSVLQELAFFAADPVPLDLAILLDTSVSMRGKMAMAREAAVGFVRTLRAGDRATVIEFNDAAHVLQPLIEDLARVESAIRETTAGGGRALYTALYLALNELARQNSNEVRRQAIVLLSDGEDSRSLVTSDEVLELARRSGIVIYSISLRSNPSAPRVTPAPRVIPPTLGGWFASKSERLMRTLAEETGGRAFFPHDTRELVPLYGIIAEELASQYTLGYNPKNPKRDSAVRRLAVRLPSQPGGAPTLHEQHDAGRPDAAVRVCAGQRRCGDPLRAARRPFCGRRQPRLRGRLHRQLHPPPDGPQSARRHQPGHPRAAHGCLNSRCTAATGTPKRAPVKSPSAA